TDRDTGVEARGERTKERTRASKCGPVATAMKGRDRRRVVREQRRPAHQRRERLVEVHDVGTKRPHRVVRTPCGERGQRERRARTVGRQRAETTEGLDPCCRVARRGDGY